MRLCVSTNIGMACHLIGTKSFSEPMLPYCQLDNQECLSVAFYLKFKSFHSRKCVWKCRLDNSGHFVSASMCWIAFAKHSHCHPPLMETNCDIDTGNMTRSDNIASTSFTSGSWSVVAAGLLYYKDTSGHTYPEHHASSHPIQGWGLLSQFLPLRYFPDFSALSKQPLAIENHIYIWQVSPQLGCGGTCQI